MKKTQKGAGRKAENGNITVDLGEAIDKKLRSVIGDARREAIPAKMAGPYRPGMFSGGYRPGGLRPSFGNRPALGGNGGSFKPWYADRDSRFSSLSMGALGLKNDVKTWDLLTGAGVGLIGNRALVRITPMFTILGSSSVVHNGIAFVAGLIPALIKQNSVTLGVALPGAVYFGGSIIDWAMNKIGIAPAGLAGGAKAPQGNEAAALAARQRLVEMQQRTNPRAQAAAPAPSRVYAQAAR